METKGKVQRSPKVLWTFSLFTPELSDFSSRGRRPFIS
ncbi:hypothetical protein MmTuc01_0076 [Methanosarcina mazei Tuc01]|uniref:Uncharacterized protein n=1 Tax=Methanosarcina mazei Tuc01 TaxID=1236903 RepID=M1Q5X2_METMZ|nr:hypothetical protein MmTuc01_0076 [Methanosarcina mazei Tuc01]